MTCLEGKTVILVTHQVEFVSSVDNILVMQDGQVTQSENYEDLLMEGTAFEQLVNAHKDAITGLQPSPHEHKSKLQKTGNMHQRTEHAHKSYDSKENNEEQISAKGIPGVQLTEEKEKEIGNVGWKPFLDYVIISKGSWFFFLCILMHVGFVGFQAATSYWLAFGIQIPEISIIMLIGVYTFVSSASIFFVLLRSVFTTLLGLKASRSFFTQFTNSIFSAPMVFFDSTPVGRILTRKLEGRKNVLLRERRSFGLCSEAKGTVWSLQFSEFILSF
ncbi:hypothetical protein L6452_33423 [Arctium lappa]|uniref:Uncharacterized protein n=1 Tax=Arctium lappa TaxID=4217 RepID=A0ACB8YER4_ARCLA|nr:hypothetical protein L6452_33423 [Arctium lappa]